MKILIAIPAYENILPDTFQSVWDLDKCGHDCRFIFVRGYDVAMSRNRMANKAIEVDADYILMVDNDVVLPKDALKLLLEDIKPVCLGVYPYRPKEEKPVDRTIIFKNEKEFYTLDEMYALESKKIEVPAGGLGCALISTEVFNKLPYPWFVWSSNIFDRSKDCSEDVYFCKQCKAHGIPVYADFRVRCAHAVRFIKYI